MCCRPTATAAPLHHSPDSPNSFDSGVNSSVNATVIPSTDSSTISTLQLRQYKHVFPTDAKERERDRKNELKAQGIEKVVKKTPTASVQHEGLSPLMESLWGERMVNMESHTNSSVSMWNPRLQGSYLIAQLL